MRDLTSRIREFTLCAANGDPLPPYGAGAHIGLQVRLPSGATDWRHYSLIDPGSADAGCETYRIAVQCEPEGRGGSRHLHEAVRPGDVLLAQPPKNDFALTPHDGTSWLLAGGIGVTPLVCMATELKAQGSEVRMIYAGRSRADMAYLTELADLLGAQLTIHDDQREGRSLDLDALFSRFGARDRLVVCGPNGMLEAVLAQAKARGWNEDRVRFERFGAPAADDREFELVLAKSGRSFRVKPDQSILDCLIEQGVDLMYDCKHGACGVCSVTVLEGEIDHRDQYLSESERKSGQVMQICVSRARGPRLVLDL